MELISADQLQKYDHIIEQINHEYEKHEIIKKDLEKENDNVIICQLAKSTLTQKVSHLNVQVFHKCMDLLNLYGEELQSDSVDLLKCNRSKFYLIEIYITKLLMQKAKGLKCILHIIINTDNVSINKTVALRNDMPIREIIPVDSSTINSTVEASLVVPSEGKWLVIKLDSVCIDISYHFRIYKNGQKIKSKAKNILRIAELYNKNVIKQNLLKPVAIESKLFCDIEVDLFISTMLKNCYHSLDLELFLELKNYKNKKFTLKLSNGIDVMRVIFEKEGKCLKLESNIYNLCLLKKYFVKELYKKSPIDADLMSNTAKMLKKNENISHVPEDVCAFFYEVRESWAKLPI